MKDHKWIMDSGCSRHMSGKSSLFSEISQQRGGTITLGDKKKCDIIGIGKVGTSSKNSISDVYLDEGLKFNLLSVSQLCDKGHKVVFDKDKCVVQDEESGKCILTAPRPDNVYIVHTNHVVGESLKCLKALKDDSKLWHRKLGHVSFHTLNKLVSKDLVRGLPPIKFKEEELCKACTQGKQTRSSFKPKKVVSTTRPIELLHMDLCGPVRVRSPKGKQYILVIVDEF